MSLIKKLAAIVCVLAILMSFAGCHKKNEIAVTVGDVEFTSAYYMCTFVTADMQARQKVSENLTEAEQTSGEVDIYSKEIDGKKYADWVKDTAIDELKKIAAYKTLCKNNSVELDDEAKAEAQEMADYYWAYYGYQSYMEPNGVSQATYNAYMLDSYYASTYFEHLYSEGGEKEIAASEVENKMYESFEIANLLEGSYTGSDGTALDDTAKGELKAKFEAYLDELQTGKRTFEEIYKEYNQITDEETTEETTEESEEDKELEPLDKYATLMGSEDTDYASDHFETVKAMTVGEIKLVDLSDDAGIAILVKQDIKADPYYSENLDLIVRRMLKGDEFDADIEAFAKTLDFKESTFATGQFKVKEIVYPESSY